MKDNICVNPIELFPWLTLFKYGRYFMNNLLLVSVYMWLTAFIDVGPYARVLIGSSFLLHVHHCILNT